MFRTSATAFRLMACLCLALATTACTRGVNEPSVENAASPSGEKPDIFVVNYPLLYLAERLGGDLVEVHFPAPRDVDPALWKPNVETINAYQQADVILLNGADYAKWIATATLPQSKLVDTTAAVTDKYIQLHDTTTHSHGPQGEHTHEGFAFTTWLDLQIAIEQAESVRKTLLRLLPNRSETLEANSESLMRDLSALDRQLESLVSSNPDQPLVASHPVYQYLARRYGLNLKSVHWEPDEMPNDDLWQQLKQLLDEHPAEWIIWEGPPNDQVVARLKTLGVDSLVCDPCGNVPEDGDFLSVMTDNVANLGRAFQESDAN